MTKRFTVEISAADEGAVKPWRKRLHDLDEDQHGARVCTGEEWLEPGGSYELPVGAVIVGCDPRPGGEEKRVRIWRLKTNGRLKVERDSTLKSRSAFGASVRGTLRRLLEAYPPAEGHQARQVGAAPPRANKWADQCCLCCQPLPARAGILERDAGRSRPRHRPGECPPPPPRENDWAQPCGKCGGWLEAGTGVLYTVGHGLGAQKRARHREECPPADERKAPPPRTNSRAQGCERCGVVVPPEGGELLHAGAGWMVRHWEGRCPQPNEDLWEIGRGEPGSFRPRPERWAAPGTVLRSRLFERADRPFPEDAPGYRRLSDDEVTAIVTTVREKRPVYCRDKDGDQPGELIGEDGWYFRIFVRPASADEAAGILDEEEKAARRRALDQRRKALFDIRLEDCTIPREPDLSNTAPVNFGAEARRSLLQRWPDDELRVDEEDAGVVWFLAHYWPTCTSNTRRRTRRGSSAIRPEKLMLRFAASTVAASAESFFRISAVVRTPQGSAQEATVGLDEQYRPIHHTPPRTRNRQLVRGHSSAAPQRASLSRGDDPRSRKPYSSHSSGSSKRTSHPQGGNFFSRSKGVVGLLYAGIDWSDKWLDCAVVDRTGALVAERRIVYAAGDDPVAQYRDFLRPLARRWRATVTGIEDANLLFSRSLAASGMTVVHVDPTRAARHRSALGIAKSDRADAAVIAAMVRNGIYRPVVSSPDAEAFRAVTQAHRAAVAARTEALHALRAALVKIWPAAVSAWSSNVGGLRNSEARAVLAAAPGPRSASALTRDQLADLLRNAGRTRSIDGEAERLHLHFCRPVMLLDPRVEQAEAVRIRDLVAAVDHADHRANDLHRDMRRRYRAHPHHMVTAGVPGIGDVYGAYLLAEIGDRPHQRFGSGRSLAAYAGVAPVTWASGSVTRVSIRRASSRVLRSTLHTAAWAMAMHSPGAGAYYRRRRAAGDAHATAVRKLGRRLVLCLYTCMTSGVPYDDSIAFAYDPASPPPRPGRPRPMSDREIARARELLGQPRATVVGTARELGVSTQTIYRHVLGRPRSAS
ncbi:IS110 family transposase [Streptomyces sp. NRRL F-5053]|uniref:IS110 family transposase n=1 Tax=Streptomyces sp. NRRL F-5053 TaxID=1463854 RepID=UPI0013316EFD|nr:IS110 family transposase [Streptomyces sp. NRRL F-5053]